MARFLVQVRGDSFLLSMDGEHGKFGFTASRVIEAGSREEAAQKAVIQIHQQLRQNEQIVKNIPDLPRVSVVSTKKLGPLSGRSRKRNQGFDFFVEEDSSADGTAD